MDGNENTEYKIMSKKNKKKIVPYTECFNRYCPICGVEIKTGDPLHQCKEENIKYSQEDYTFEEIEWIEPGFGEKLEDAEYWMDMDLYNEENDNDI